MYIRMHTLCKYVHACIQNTYVSINICVYNTYMDTSMHVQYCSLCAMFIDFHEVRTYAVYFFLKLHTASQCCASSMEFELT